MITLTWELDSLTELKIGAGDNTVNNLYKKFHNQHGT